MTTDISGFGLQVNVLAVPTFPVGFTVTQFADDADPFDIPAIDIADKAMGLNGDLIVWSKNVPIVITLNVIPGSDDDKNLGILLESNRVGRGKQSARDLVTLTAIYPTGEVLVLQQGRITGGTPGTSVASSGRKKTKNYTFTFENKAEV